MASLNEISPAAFALAGAAGAASFLSPCVLPLLPGYLSFVSGVSVDRLHINTRRVVLSTLAFVLGFTVVFTLYGAGAALVGDVLLRNRRALQIGSGVLLILLGVTITGLVPLRFLQGEHRALPFRAPQGVVGAAATGVAFSIGWTPCVGPILASILTLAASGRNPAGGALLLATYSLGLGVPFLFSGVFFTRAMGAFTWVKRHFKLIKVASGVLLVAYGLLMVSGQFTWLSARLAGYQLFEF
ncbi:MAG: cytochrome c biogenesis protein CcdA [Thermoleophilia bacterium]|nr:cytochrome c biogenesis protein CcdA [Thermoleophilia bacterium]